MTRTTVSHISKAVSVVALVGIGCLVLLGLAVPRATRSIPLTVLTASMSPTIPAGSLVFVKPTQPASIEEGDVITFQSRPGVSSLITHRVIDIEDGGGQLSFVTKGDANRGADLNPVPADAVRGRVLFHVPFVGTWADEVRSPLGAAVLIGGPCALYLALQARELLAKRRQRHDVAPPARAASPIDVRDPSPTGASRALLLARVDGDAAARRELVLVVSGFGGIVTDVSVDRMVLMVAGEPLVLDEVEDQLRRLGCSEIRRSSVVSFEDPTGSVLATPQHERVSVDV